MAKRHTHRNNDITTVVERLQELVMANSGEDTFEEIFKMLVAKIFCESEKSESAVFSDVAQPAEEKRNEFNRLLASAVRMWPGILDRDFESKLKSEHLAACLTVINGSKVSGSDFEALDHAFEFLVSQASKGAKGQYFTPRHVVECCIRMLNPQPNESIFDPACGSGGFLFHALRHIQANQPGTDLDVYSSKKIWGTDFDAKAAKTARALLILAGAPRSNIFRINSLLRPSEQPELGIDPNQHAPLNLDETLAAVHPKFKGFDIIATNPPFAGEITERAALSPYDLAAGQCRVERDVLFIERCIHLLRPGGRLAIVVPHNKVGGKSFSNVREWLLQRARVVSVIGLARETFLPHTHQKTSIIFCEKRLRPSAKLPDETILFQVSSLSGKDGKGKFIERKGFNSLHSSWDRFDHDLSDIVSDFQNFKQEQSINW